MKGFRMKDFRILKTLLLYIHILDGIAALTIDVSKGRCGSTIDLARHVQVYLDYQGEMLVPDECTYAFTNNDWNKEICIRISRGQSNINCAMVFSYYIGQKNRYIYNAKSCSDFYLKPLCTNQYKVFATFKNGMSGGIGGISLSKAHVVIYLKTPPPPTTYRPHNSYNIDDGPSYTTAAFIGIFSVLFLVCCCICCARCRRQSNKPVPNRGRDLINYAPNQGFDRSEPRPTTTQERNGTQQNISPEETLNSNYNWGPPSYEECANQSNYGPDTNRMSGNQAHLYPFTITTSTQQVAEKGHGALDEMEPPPSYESLSHL